MHNNIFIDTVRIAGFRGINNLEISLSRLTVLLGANNSGKTSLLKALRLALGDYSYYLSEDDLHISVDGKQTKEILIDVRIVPSDNHGNRMQFFHEEWLTEFGDKVKSEANGSQYVALRTRSKHDLVKGNLDTSRMTLERWPEYSNWQTDKIKETKMLYRFQNMPFIAAEAQRDIHQELREKSSFIGKVLSSIEYNQGDINDLELLIQDINDKAVSKSSELGILKNHLEKLSQSFQGSGNAEITPFPKKIRDLSKQFSIHFGENSENTFSMEYHGMGTRSWASLLTVKAFTDLMASKHKQEATPFFPIFSAEEPEAHLHPNAQKTLYRQLADYNGQVIVSTHSPYLAAISDQIELRYLKKSSGRIEAHRLNTNLGDEDRRRLQREILHSRGEIIFSKAIVLCEGETEEQSLPILFQKYFGSESFMLGVSFVGIAGSGKKYLPFFSFARDFSIPIFIFSDGENKAVKELKKHYEVIFGNTDIENCHNITILNNVNFEQYLISSGFRVQIESAIKAIDGEDSIQTWIKTRDRTLLRREKTSNPECITCKQFIFADIFRDYQSTDGYDQALIDIISSSKPKYAPVIAEKLCYLDAKDFPEKIIDLFEKIKVGVGV